MVNSLLVLYKENYSHQYWDFSSTEKFLDNIIISKYSKEECINLYSEWLKRVVTIIKTRTKNLEKEIKNAS